MTTNEENGFLVVGQQRIPFEAPESIGYAIVVATFLIMVTEVSAAVLAAFNSAGILNGPYFVAPVVPPPAVAQTLARATAWATPYFPLLLFSVLAIVWWQVRAWSEVVGDPDGNDDEALQDALTHLLRARTMSGISLVLLTILFAAAVGGVVANAIENAQSSGQAGAEAFAEYVEVIGVGLATCVLTGAGMGAALHFRHSIDATFANAEGEAFGDDSEDVGTPEFSN